MFWGRQKIHAIPDKQNFNSCYTSSHCEVAISKWAYCSLQEQCLLTLSMYSSLKFNLVSYVWKVSVGHAPTANISLWDTFQNNSQSYTNLEQLIKFLASSLEQSEQGRSSPKSCSDTGCFKEMQTVVVSGSIEPCVSNLGFSHGCFGILMLVLKIKWQWSLQWVLHFSSTPHSEHCC